STAKKYICRAGQTHVQDSSDSDSELDGVPAPRPSGSGFGSGPCVGSLPRIQVIHSGHFMVSSPHSDASPRRRRRSDFDTVNRTGSSLSIDPTLTRLFECMSLAYSGKIVSPKWKSFKGLRLLWRDKIRLNNAIWRAWFIQYVEKRKNPVCGFVSPLEGSEADAHRKPEAIVLEGSYWKRRIEVVIKEYHKWRIYYKKRVRRTDLTAGVLQGQICQAKLDKWTNQKLQEPEAAPVEVHMFDLDCLLSDISDTLFTMTQKPCPWTNDRHNTYTSNADIIQPGLTPLQPNLEDFMEIPDIFMTYRSPSSDHTPFSDCGYFEGSSNAAFVPVPSPVVTTPQLLINTHMAQPGLSSDSLSQPSSSSSQPDQVQTRSEYPPGPMPCVHQSYPDTPVSMAFSGGVDQPGAAPFLYPLPCHKFGYYSPTGVTSTVITHTASSLGAPAYPSHPMDAFTPPPYPPAAVSDPVHAPPHPVGASHCFTVPEQVAATGGGGVRGKYKQKTGGVSAVAPPTSCLAKLLSSGTRERKPSLGFDAALVTTKGQRSLSPGSASSGAVHPSTTTHHRASWPSGIPVLTPLQGQSAVLTHGPTSTGTTVSALLNHSSAHGSTHTSTALLIPKTEKLSPVQLYSSERSGLTVNFSAHPGQTSPPNLLDKTSNPESPHSGFSAHAKLESTKQTETRRITHISAEQKRRFNIRLGFDTLHNLVTTLSSQPSIKISKATTLQKTAEYISKMQQDRSQLHEEAQRLREEIQLLNSAINVCQQQLPATGIPITRQRFDHMRQKFREYVQAQTLQNWKFWIFSIIIEPLFESYNGMVSTASVEDLCRSTLSWLDQHCSLPALRPMVLSSLRLLSTTTTILTDPALLPEQAALAVTQGNAASALDHSLQPPTQENIHPM
uniref:MLX interacting protein like n=1 Tax=Sphaeramia orbicularis TaxID=375764 RepID=A0A673BR46_9TELE